jgi:5-methyltetrahydrofolate--homocysteine methyltransferase
MAATLTEFAQQGWLNMVGGCCGSTPAHIAAIARGVKPHAARPTQAPIHDMRLSGLESLVVRARSV